MTIVVTKNTEGRLVKIRALEQSATAGPWEREQDSSIVSGRIIYIRSEAIHPALVAVLTEGQYYSFEQAADDFAFIVGMRDHVPWLLELVDKYHSLCNQHLEQISFRNDQIEELQERVRELEAELDAEMG